MIARAAIVALLAVGGAAQAQEPERARSEILPSVMVRAELAKSIDPGGEKTDATGWSARADSLRDAGRHREAIAAWLRAMQLGVAEPSRAAFDVARAYAHLENRRQSLRWLEHAIALGFTDRELVRTEHEFDRYRDDARFRAIAEGIGRSPGWREA